MPVHGLSRRSALRAAGVFVVGIAGGAVVARSSSAARSPAGGTAANAYGSTPSGGRLLSQVAAVPVGGGRVLTSPPIVITRGTGTDAVHAFTAICTHQGCTVDRVASGVINCPCHGSGFDATTGAVVRGPATRPLRRVPVVVRDGGIYTS